MKVRKESSCWSVQFSRSVVSDSLQLHELQHARPPCPSPSPGVHSNSCPSSQWCHPAISSSVVPFSSCPQPLPASESFPVSQLFAWGGQSTGVSASISFLPKNTQGWSPLEWTGCISLQSKGLSRIFSNTTVQIHQFFGTYYGIKVLHAQSLTYTVQKMCHVLSPWIRIGLIFSALFFFISLTIYHLLVCTYKRVFVIINLKEFSHSVNHL